MVKNIDHKIRKVSKKKQAQIQARADELIAEEMTMRDLRNALHLTQKDVAKKLGINQDNVSRLEARSDILLSTLQTYVRSLGGELSLRAAFPDRPPVLLTGIAAIQNQKTAERRKGARKPKS